MSDAKIYRAGSTLNMKIQLGNKTKKELRKELEKYNVSDLAWKLFDEMEIEKPQEIELKIVSVKELGFSEPTQYKDIVNKAKEKGLELCLAEVGPQLRLQYLDQPLGEWLSVAMEAIRDSDGDLYVFRVGHGGDGLWLYSDDGEPDGLWDPGYRFVFRKSNNNLVSKEPCKCDSDNRIWCEDHVPFSEPEEGDKLSPPLEEYFGKPSKLEDRKYASPKHTVDDIWNILEINKSQDHISVRIQDIDYLLSIIDNYKKMNKAADDSLLLAQEEIERLRKVLEEMRNKLSNSVAENTVDWSFRHNLYEIAKKALTIKDTKV